MTEAGPDGGVATTGDEAGGGAVGNSVEAAGGGAGGGGAGDGMEAASGG